MRPTVPSFLFCSPRLFSSTHPLQARESTPAPLTKCPVVYPSSPLPSDHKPHRNMTATPVKAAALDAEQDDRHLAAAPRLSADEYNAAFANTVSKIKSEGRYRVFADLERHVSLRAIVSGRVACVPVVVAASLRKYSFTIACCAFQNILNESICAAVPGGDPCVGGFLAGVFPFFERQRSYCTHTRPVTAQP